MSDVNKTIQIKYQAEVQNLVSGLTKVGNVSQKEAQKIINSLEKAYKKAAQDSEKAAKKQKDELQKVSRQAKKTARGIKESTKRMAQGFAVAGLAVFSFQQHIADLSNQLVDASAKTGVAVDTLAGLRLAAEGSGLSFETLEAGLVKLPTLMKDAANGSKTASKAFGDLEVEVSEFRDGVKQLRSADDVLKDVFHSLQQIESAEEKAAAASKLFGWRAGPAFIQSGAIDNLDSFMGLANEFGVSTGPEMQKQMAEFQRISSSALTVLQGEFSRLLNTAFGEGGMNEGMLLVTEGIIAFGTIAQQQIKIVASGFNLVTGIVTNAYDALTGGSIDEAVKRNNENLKDLGEKFVGIGDIFSVIEDRQASFRKALEKTLVTPIRAKTGVAPPSLNLGNDTKKRSKEEIEAEKEKQRLLKVTKELTRNLSNEQRNLGNLSIENKRTIIDLMNDEIAKIRATKDLDLSLNTERISAIEQQKIKNEELAETEEQLAIAKQVNLELDQQITEVRKQSSLIAQKASEDEIKASEELSSKKKAEAFAVAGFYVQSAQAASELIKSTSKENKQAAIVAFRISQAAALAEIIMTTAQKVMEVAPNPLAMAGIGALGGLQAATVLAQSPPEMHMGGFITKGEDTSNATVLSGEAVLSRRTVERMGGEKGINQLQRGNLQNQVIVMQPFKHFDRFVQANKKRGGSLSRISLNKASGAY